MRKPTIIKHIKRIIEEWGAFGSGEIEGSLGETYSPCVNSMGGLVALAEYFKPNEVEVNVYDPESFSSDAMHTYTVSYEDLSKDALEEILTLAEQYEADQIKTEKRCEN
jgi:hypothetical protein